MTDGTTRRYNEGEVLSGVQRRRRWTPEEKVQIVEETYLPGMSVSLVARRHGISGSQVFTWRRLMSQGALTAAAAGEEVVPASEYRALEAQVRELHRLLGKKAMENELLREAVSRARPKKTAVAFDLVAGGWPVSAVAQALDIARPHLSAMRNRPPPRPRGRPPLPDAELVAEIRLLVAGLPTYGYRRVHALLRRQAQKTGRAAPNPKRVYRVMKVHGLLLQRHGERREERRHDGRVAVEQRNTRWCSDGLEIACDNGEKVRVAFALDCCDREAMGHVATTAGITAEDVQDLMVATVEHRYGQVNRVPQPIEWLTDNGSCYTARNTRAFARDIGLVPRTTPVSSPQSNGMAEAFVRTLKRDYVRVSPRPDAQTVIEQLPGWLAHYNEMHPHRALGYRSPREYIAKTREAPSGI
ncbi:IS3 family transposase [Sphingomonas sp. AP4-R1]|uniref:IS3 family transposase n=1 Tax=Sphingomonas sp. AP4-R1 TaxID=2735134 RepID=UPI0014938DB8|nr:IS3 family transposase [Sphingomonas sp. AP4-R1]QJU56959.1 IS3 family transposase [Sphingomonas sp. AP4-R1]